jgi:N-acetyl-beta-hexosaminidase
MLHRAVEKPRLAKVLDHKGKRMNLLRLCALLSLFVSVPAAAAASPSLIPLPQSVTAHEGAFPMTNATVVQGDGAAQSTANYLARALELKTGKRGASRILLVLGPNRKVTNPEGYRLTISAREVRIEASDPRGLFYGAQTLRQLVTKSATGERSLPALDISDAPRFRWRGLLIDVSRHFFGKPMLLKIIEEMAAYKLNVLKLHLTDYQGWRLEIPGYPKLTDVGALVDGKPQYFTTADMREIVRYAADRHIMVVPEIEMPGHAGAAARAYPEFFDDAGGAFNPANHRTYDFIRGVRGHLEGHGGRPPAEGRERTEDDRRRRGLLRAQRGGHHRKPRKAPDGLGRAGGRAGAQERRDPMVAEGQARRPRSCCQERVRTRDVARGPALFRLSPGPG